jgi:hypothetical protein
MRTITSVLFMTLLPLGILHAQQPVATTAASALASPSVSQQPTQPGQVSARYTKEMRARIEVVRMKSQLALTDSQVVKVEKIALKYAELTEELQKKIMELRNQQTEEIKPLLTPEQLKKLNKPLMRAPVQNGNASAAEPKATEAK